MTDMTDKAAGELQSVGTQVGRSTANAGARAGIKIGKGTFGIGIGIGAGVVYGTVKSIIALVEASRRYSSRPGTVNGGSRERQVGLREFTRIAGSKREFMPIQDAEIARQFGRELRKHGVTFAIEKQADGSRLFHVQGKDASLVENALRNAAAVVDERITRAREKGESLGGDIQEAKEQVLELNDETKEKLSSALRESATKAPAVDSRPPNTDTDLASWEAKVTDLADVVERDGRIPLTAENVEILQTALADYAPTDLDVVKEAVAEERNAAAAVDAPEAQHMPQEDLDLSDVDVVLDLRAKEPETLAEALRGDSEGINADELPESRQERIDLAEEITRDRQVALTPQNVRMLDQEFTEQGWNENPPRSLAWVVTAVADERTRTEALAVGKPEVGHQAEELEHTGYPTAGEAWGGQTDEVFPVAAEPTAGEPWFGQPAEVVQDAAAPTVGEPEADRPAEVVQDAAAPTVGEPEADQPAEVVQETENPFLRSDLPEQGIVQAPTVGTVEAETVTSEANPYLSDEVAQDAPQLGSAEPSVSQGSVGAVAAPAPSAGAGAPKATQGQGVAQPKTQSAKTAASSTAATGAKTQKPERELSKRDETRKKVSERIEAKTVQIKHDHQANAQSRLNAPKPDRAPKR